MQRPRLSLQRAKVCRGCKAKKSAAAAVMVRLKCKFLRSDNMPANLSVKLSCVSRPLKDFCYFSALLYARNILFYVEQRNEKV